MLGLHSINICDDIVARHTNFVSSVSQEAPMVWLEEQSSAPINHVTNRFVTHVEDIYYIDNNIHNTNIENVALSMSFLNEMMTKAADIYASVYSNSYKMLDKSGKVTAPQNKNESPSPLVETTTAHTLSESIKTVKTMSELQQITARDIVTLSQETINNLKNNQFSDNFLFRTAVTEHVAGDVNDISTQLVEKIEKNSTAINNVSEKIHNLTEVNTDNIINSTNINNENTKQKPRQTAPEKTVTDTEKATDTRDVFTSRMLDVRLKPTQNMTTVNKTERVGPHYDNRSYNRTQEISSATVIYDENGRRVEGEAKSEVKKETSEPKKAESVTLKPTETEVTQNVTTDNNVTQTSVFTSSDIVNTNTQNSVSHNVSTVENRHSETNMIHSESDFQANITEQTVTAAAKAAVKASEKAQQKNADAPTVINVTNNVFTVSDLSGDEITRLTLQSSAVRNIINNSAHNINTTSHTVHGGVLQNILKNSSKNIDTSALTVDNVYNVQSYVKRQNLLHAEHITSNETQNRTDSKNLSVQQNNLSGNNYYHTTAEGASVALTLGDSVKNLIQNARQNLTSHENAVYSNLLAANIFHADGGQINYSENNAFAINRVMHSSAENYTHVLNNTQISPINMEAVPIVFKEEYQPTSTETVEEGEDEIITIKKTKKIENTQETENITNKTIKNHQIVTTADGINLANLDSAGIATLADKVYRQLESRLKNERNRRGLK